MSSSPSPLTISLGRSIEGQAELMTGPERQYTLREILDRRFVRLSSRKLRTVVQEMGFSPSTSSGKYVFSKSQVREIQGRVGAQRQQNCGRPTPSSETARAVIAHRRQEAIEKKNRN